MDLDFSFALVSSLTPRRKAEKCSSTVGLKKDNLLKTRLNVPNKSQNSETSHKKKEEKENLIPNNRLMNKNEFVKPSESKRKSSTTINVHKRESSGNYDFQINFENIAVRKQRTRRKNSETNPFQPLCLEVSDEKSAGDSSVQNTRISPFTSDVIISPDIEEKGYKTRLSKNKCNSFSVKSQINGNSLVQSSPDVVESSFSDVKDDSFDNCRSLRSLSSKNRNVKNQPTRSSLKSETSLSTAYDSDLFQASRRCGAKVIAETPDSDKSLEKSFNEKRKSSIFSLSLEENKETCNFRNSIKESPKKNVKRKSSEISCSPDEKRCSTESLPVDSRPKRKSSLLSFTSDKNKPEDELNCDGIVNNTIRQNNPVCNVLSNVSSKIKSETKLNKKLRKSTDSSVSDMFKLESTIKDQPPLNFVKDELSKIKFGSTFCSNNENVKRGRKPKVVEKPDCAKENRVEEKEVKDQINFGSQTTNDNDQIQFDIPKNKQRLSISPKMSSLVLPSEIIPKFEHISQWLKDTQGKAIGSSIDGSGRVNKPSKKDVVPIKNKYKISLSPRIKKKKEKAKSSLEEEQKLFEELYGDDYGKRQSDADEVLSRTSSQDSVEFSENVLDKLYGSVYKQENTAVTQSEPRKGRKKKNSKKKTPLTERKKHRTSIYEVFSSSSSEDRFEEFLENVHRGKVESTKRHSGRPATPDFIKDSESDDDNQSLVYYQNILSSAVKDDVHSLKKEINKTEKGIPKVNRRRLSFGSSKDDACSESGKSDTKPTAKSKKSSNEEKNKTKKSRSKKKTSKDIDEKREDDIEVFSLVTPIKIKAKNKKPDVEKVNLLDVPRSVGKSKTPKNSTLQKDLSNSEERLKTKYLRDIDFKMPKSASKVFKTPSKSIKPDVPASPALSFLSSLSEMTAGLPCHPEALVYKKNFKAKREELTKRLFTLYNKEVFDNQLPEDMLIQWNTRMTSTSGYCYNKRIYRNNEILRSSRIVLSTKILDRADRLRDTLIHELCHAATWIVHATSDGHGPIWRSWADKANRRFPELPVIKRCHDYAISTKFTYKCMSCGYSIGRHTKSLDTERKRCGFCFGKFQVFVTAKMSSASVTSGSDSVKTPRNPTGFALFVKENYAIVKKENNVPHAQVMKLLSQKFAEVKISKQNTEEPIVIE